MTKTLHEKLQRNSDDILVVISDEEEKFRLKFFNGDYGIDEGKRCTICNKIARHKIFPHSTLRVSVCFQCSFRYEDVLFLTSKDGTDLNCRWCAKSAQKYCCSLCTVVFCKDCLERNFGADFVRNRVQKSSWSCLICNPKQLWRLRALCSKAMEISDNSSRLNITDFKNMSSQKVEEILCAKSPTISDTKDDSSSDILCSMRSNLTQSSASNLPTTRSKLSTLSSNKARGIILETIKELHSFDQLFHQRVSEIENKCGGKNLNEQDDVETLVNKLSEFCKKAVRNIQCIDQRNRTRYRSWSNKFRRNTFHLVTSSSDSSSDEEIHLDSVPLERAEEERIIEECENNLKKAVQEQRPSSVNSNCVLSLNEPSCSYQISSVKQEPLPSSTISKVALKKRRRKKYNLSLKQKSKRTDFENTSDLSSDGTIVMLDDIKQKLSTDKQQTSQKSNSPIVNNKILLEAKVILVDINKFPSFIDSNPNDLSADDKLLSPSQIKRCKDDDEISTFSNTTVAFDPMFISQNDPQISVKNETESINFFQNRTEFDRETLNAQSDLQTRLLEDFSDEESLHSNTNYLCEKTGQLFKCYQTTDEYSNDSAVSLNDLSSHSNDDKTDTELSHTNKETTEDSKDFEIKTEELDLHSSYEIDDNDSCKTEVLDENVEEKLMFMNNINLVPKGSLSDSVVSEEREEIISDSEIERDEALRELMSDFSQDSLSSSESETSTSEFIPTEVETDVEVEYGRITNLDLASELVKLQRHHDSSATDDDLVADHFKKDPKLFNCSVKLERLNFESSRYIIKGLDHRTDSDLEDMEIRRLTNMDNLKRNHCSSDSSDSSCNDNMKLLRKKKRKNRLKSSNDELDNSSEYELSSASDFSINSRDSEWKPGSAYSAEDNFMLALDKDSASSADDEFTEDDEDENLKKESKKSEPKNDDVVLLDDDDKPKDDDDKSEDSKRSKWRNDALLNRTLALTDSDATNDSIANDVLQKQEKNYLKKAELYRQKIETKSDSTDTLTVISSDTDSDSESDESDCLVIGESKKRKSTELSSDEECNVKKGRKNIKKVISDKDLQEETQLADKEEEERRERISMKNKSLETVLSQSSLCQDEIGLVLDVDEEKKQPLVSVHPALMTRLKRHQVSGIKFMWDVAFESLSQIRASRGAGCILAHCMGLGKTMQVVVLAHTLLTHNHLTNVKHILIVCPLSTVFNWRIEFSNTLKVVSNKIDVFDIQPDRQRKYSEKLLEIREWRRKGGVLIVGYEFFQTIVATDKKRPLSENNEKLILESLVNPGPDLVVCDEGHMLKNGKTNRFQSLSRVKTKRRIILTGTPLQNNLKEYYYMVSFVKPNLLGTYKEYANRFVNPIMNGQYEDSGPEDIKLMKKRSHVLHKKLETTVQRYEVSELAPYLPDKHDYVLFVQLTDLQIKLYSLYLESIDTDAKRLLFQNFHDLQNIWTHPSLLSLKYSKKISKPKTYDEDFVPTLDPDNTNTTLSIEFFQKHFPEDIMTNIEYGSKMVVLFSIIKECQAMGDKLLVFSSSIAELDLIEFFLKQTSEPEGVKWIKDQDYYRMDGTVAPDVRKKYCNSFNSKENTRTKLFLVSHKVGGLGLNLVAANRVVLMDVSWNPAYDIQSVFRVYRFGQEKECYIYRLVTKGTMEEVVYGRAITKLAIACRVVDEQQITRHFKSDDLQRMYQLNLTYKNQEPPTPGLPADRLLAKLWNIHSPMLYDFHDHQSLLENLTHEELNEEEMKLAWEEFRNEEMRERIIMLQQIQNAQNQKLVYRLSDEPGTSGLQDQSVQQPINYSLPRVNNQVSRFVQPTIRPLGYQPSSAGLSNLNINNHLPILKNNYTAPQPTMNMNVASFSQSINTKLGENNNNVVADKTPAVVSATSGSFYVRTNQNVGEPTPRVGPPQTSIARLNVSTIPIPITTQLNKRFLPKNSVTAQKENILGSVFNLNNDVSLVPLPQNQGAKNSLQVGQHVPLLNNGQINFIPGGNTE